MSRRKKSINQFSDKLVNFKEIFQFFLKDNDKFNRI